VCEAVCVCVCVCIYTCIGYQSQTIGPHTIHNLHKHESEVNSQEHEDTFGCVVVCDVPPHLLYIHAPYTVCVCVVCVCVVCVCVYTSACGCVQREVCVVVAVVLWLQIRDSCFVCHVCVCVCVMCVCVCVCDVCVMCVCDV